MKKIMRRLLKSRFDLWHKPCTFNIQAGFAFLDNSTPNQANTRLIENRAKILINEIVETCQNLYDKNCQSS